MSTSSKRTNKNTALVEKTLKAKFADAEAYQYNSASIRVRVVDERFRNISPIDREKLVDPLLTSLPESLQSDITILLLLAPDEVEESSMNLEFDHPSRSVL